MPPSDVVAEGADDQAGDGEKGQRPGERLGDSQHGGGLGGASREAQGLTYEWKAAIAPAAGQRRLALRSRPRLGDWSGSQAAVAVQRVQDRRQRVEYSLNELEHGYLHRVVEGLGMAPARGCRNRP